MELLVEKSCVDCLHGEKSDDEYPCNHCNKYTRDNFEPDENNSYLNDIFE